MKCSVNKDACHQARGPELGPWILFSKRRELMPTNPSMMSPEAVKHIKIHPHIHTHTKWKCNKNLDSYGP